MRRAIGAGVVLAMLGGAALAAVSTEVTMLNGAKITLYLRPFLTATDLATLRLVATNPEALKLFVPSDKGFAAIALAPAEGFLQDGKPVASAFAIAELPDAATAAAKALEGCDAARKSGRACVIVMEIGH